MLQINYCRDIQITNKKYNQEIQLQKGHMNALVLLCDKPLDEDSTIKVKLLDVNNKTLFDDIPLSIISAMQDMDFGASSAAAKFNKTLQSMDRFAYLVDLGSIYLDLDKELIVNLDCSIASLSDNEKEAIEVLQVTYNRAPYFAREVYLTTDKEQRRQNVSAIYISTHKKGIEVVDKKGKNIKATFDIVDERQIDCTAYQAGLVNSILGRCEVVQDRRLALMWRSDNASGDTVHTRIAGSECDDIEILVVTNYVDSKSVRESSLSNLSMTKNKTLRAEREDPQRQKAVRSLVSAPKSEDLEEIEEIVEKKINK